jgi:phosphopantothenoylcysteine decarboxylase/phosphopantothenate--cysteine ligase
MRCIVTAGPTYEPLDQVRRLTNFSTGRLGTQLARFLAGRGHSVTLLRGAGAVHQDSPEGVSLDTFTTTDDLAERLRRHAAGRVDAVFHAAAVSDFKFGAIWERTAGGGLLPVQGGKISTRRGVLLAELIPTVKILAGLRSLYPAACLVGWKYAVDGTRDDVLAQARSQLAECHTDACVANGPAYGPGFGLVHHGEADGHLPDATALFSALERLVLDTARASH